jgi:hypothetical protein
MLAAVVVVLVVAEARLEQVVLAVAEMVVHQALQEAMAHLILAGVVAVAGALSHLPLAVTAALAS